MTLAVEVLSHFHLPVLSCLGLLLFFGVFVGMLFWIFRKGSDEFYQALSDLPVEAKPQNGERNL
jgi:hypothetical protein